MIYRYELKIPHERLAVLIGKDGTVKKHIEDITSAKVDVDSKEGDITISGEDAIGLYNARELILAIGRGFNPKLAEELIKGDYIFDQIYMKDYAKSRAMELRLKGRVIGEEGKSRNLIEELTDAHVSVYGKTIAFIGLPDNVAIARKAVELLLKGSNHSTVYRWLERQRKELKRKEIIGMTQRRDG